MPSPKPLLRNGRHLSAILLALVTLTMLVVRGRSAEPQRLLVYDLKTHYSVDIVEHKGKSYVGLVEVLEPLGHVEAKQDGKYWVLDFSSANHAARGRFRDGKKDAELPAGKTNLSGQFWLSNDRGYIPIEALQDVVAQLAGVQTQMHLASRHLYLNGAGTQFSVDLRRNPTRLVLTFSNPVTPSITSEGTSLRIAFNRDPVFSPGNDAVEFHDPIIQAGSFAETNTGAEYIVRASVPLVASSSEGGRVLTIQQPVAQPAPAPPPQTPAPAPQTAAPKQQPATPTPSPTPAAPAAAKPAYIVVIDAAHGGDDTGAAMGPKILEKDITLALSRRIQHELQNRGIQATLLRNSDTAISPEQRAMTANTSHAAVYISIHASALGQGVRVFTSLMPPIPISGNNRAFVPWDSAQAQHLNKSSALSGSIAFEFDKKQIRVRALQGAVLPLNSINTAAIAVEVAPSGDKVESLTSSDYMQNIAVAIANGINTARGEAEKK